MAASTLQMIMGLIRPGPDSNLRPYFNWAHFLFGKATQITAGNTLTYFSLLLYWYGGICALTDYTKFKLLCVCLNTMVLLGELQPRACYTKHY